MNDEVAMGIFDTLTDLQEKFKAPAGRQAALVAPDIDLLADDEIHNKVGAAMKCSAGIEQLHDRGVVEVRKNLSLGLEAFERVIAVGAFSDDLHGHQLTVKIVHAN